MSEDKVDKIYRAYKVELKPNNKQISFFEKSCGCKRFIYNWGLDLVKSKYERGEEYPGHFGLINEFNKIKKEKYKFVFEISSRVINSALKDVDLAFKNFFRNVKNGKKPGYPKYKIKGKCKDSFRIPGLWIKVTSTHIKLPKIKEIKFKQKNYIPLDVKYVNATISLEAGRWFVSVIVEIDKPKERGIEEVIGVDLGIKELATLSTGEVFKNHKFTTKYARRLANANRSLARKKKGSKNRVKAKVVLQKVYRKIKNCRKDNIHKMTTRIVKEKPRLIILEDLNVSGMVKNKNLAKAIFDASFREIRRQLTYKVEYCGGKVISVDRFFPSSKLCSQCHNKKEELKLSERMYICTVCGNEIDRDLNAARNLRDYFKFHYKNYPAGVADCGEAVRLSKKLQRESIFDEASNKQGLKQSP